MTKSRKNRIIPYVKYGKSGNLLCANFCSIDKAYYESELFGKGPNINFWLKAYNGYFSTPRTWGKFTKQRITNIFFDTDEDALFFKLKFNL